MLSQVIRAAFLTPDLVEAVLHGRQPAQLTLREVMKQLPWDWSEQRRRFGLAPKTNDSLLTHKNTPMPSVHMPVLIQASACEVEST